MRRMNTWGGSSYTNQSSLTANAGGNQKRDYAIVPGEDLVVKQPETPVKSGGGGKNKSTTPKATTTPTTKTVAQTVKAYSGGGGGGSSSADSGSDAYADYLKKLLKLSKNIYKQNMDAINKAYLGAGDTLRTNYDSTTGQLKDQFGYQNKLVNDDADNSMRQAYINSMLQKKDLGQKMSAMGLNGGATETTLASMNNSYSNARNNIDTTRQRSLADLNQTYQGNLADAMRQYNTAVNNLAMQRLEAENAARQAYLNMAMQFGSAGGSLGSISLPKTDYSSVLSNQSNYSYTPTAANNYVKGVNTTQSAPIAQDNRSNYAQQLARRRIAGASDSEIKNAAYSAVQSGQMSGDELMNILNQLNVQV
jgi:hypothetical protein